MAIEWCSKEFGSAECENRELGVLGAKNFLCGPYERFNMGLRECIEGWPGENFGSDVCICVPNVIVLTGL